jgi:HK97 family phage major capsid protein
VEVKEQIEALGKDINAKLAQACEQAKTAAGDEAKKVASDLKGEVGNMVTKWQDLQKIQQGQLDAVETELKKIKNSGGAASIKSFEDVISEQLEKNESRKKFKEEKKGFVIDLSQKAVGNFSSANYTGAYFIPAQRTPGIFLKPYEEQHVRDILTVGTTTSDTIRYVVDNGGEGAFATVAPGALKPQIDRDLEIKDATVKKIAAYSRVPEEMIDDIPYLTSFITQFMTEELMLVEDAQLLYGDNAGQNLNGINPQATAFASTLIIDTPNNYDVIVAAKLQIRLQKLATPTAIVVNPTDYTKLKLEKSPTDKTYLFPELRSGLGTIDGTPVIQSTSVTVGSFIVGDFRRGAAMWDRMQRNVRFYDQDQDNAIRNLVTIVMEERIALAVYRPLAFVKGTFSAAITDLTS